MKPKNSLGIGIAALALSGLLVGCSEQADPTQTAQTQELPETQQQTTAMDDSGEIDAEAPVPPIDFSGFDQTVRPQDDFERFVNGTWQDTTEMPGDRGRYGTFGILRDRAQEQVQAIIEDFAGLEQVEPGSNEQKIRDLYQSVMDINSIDFLGLLPIEFQLNLIEAASEPGDIAELMAHFARHRIGQPLVLSVGQDAGDTSRYTVYASQSGLGLPDRAFYEDDDSVADIQDAYRGYLSTLFDLAGVEQADEAAEQVFALEKQIAQHHWTRVENRDRNRTYNPVSRPELKALAPDFAWTEFLQGLDLDARDDFVVRQPSYLEGLNELWQGIPLETWKTYLQARLLDSSANLLSEAFRDAHFEFRGRTLQGLEEPQPRWRQAVDIVNASIGEAVGKEYVARHFPPEAKDRMEELVANVKQAMRNSLEDLEWMTDTTRAEAFDKLEKFNTKIGYPEQWRDYSELEIKPNELIGNLRRVAAFEYQRRLDRLDGPVDRDEWFMTPQTVNAYYSSTLNEIVFPAAILQPPFFNLQADDAVNYGAIGMVIGHEIGHGFDDQGRKSDGDGMLRDWWTEEDAAEYTKRTDRLVEQYNAFNPIDDLHIDGRLALGENIGDLGGITLALRALRLSYGDKPPEPIDGYTAEQRFFLSFAQSWRSKYRDDALRQHLRTGPHSPPRYRVMGVLPNVDAFYEAFDVSEGDAMYIAPEERVSIW